MKNVFLTLLLSAHVLLSFSQGDFNINDYYNLEAKNINSDDNGIAIKGYDVVSYFTMEKPLPGKEQFQQIYKGSIFLFANQAHLDLFATNPEKYIPAYGGWCALGMGMEDARFGNKAGKYPVDPKSYKIIDSRLFLFYHDNNFDALEYWNKDESSLKTHADSLWNKILKLQKD